MNIYGRGAYAICAAVNIVVPLALVALLVRSPWFGYFFWAIIPLAVVIFIWAPAIKRRVRLTLTDWPL